MVLLIRVLILLRVDTLDSVVEGSTTTNNIDVGEVTASGITTLTNKGRMMIPLQVELISSVKLVMLTIQEFKQQHIQITLVMLQ